MAVRPVVCLSSKLYSGHSLLDLESGRVSVDFLPSSLCGGSVSYNIMALSTLSQTFLHGQGIV